MAYVRPDRLLSAGAPDAPQIVIRSRPGADPAAIDRRLRALGATPTPVAGATSSNRAELVTMNGRLEQLVSEAIAQSQHGEYQSSAEKLTEALKAEGYRGLKTSESSEEEVRRRVRMRDWLRLERSDFHDEPERRPW